jgi:type II secretory pathway pseudopilin PulG
MQRKNSILKTNPRRRRGAFLKKRSGFAMIMAIAVIVIIATVMALSLALTTETTKRTVDLYLYEQVALHAKSGAELALLEIAKGGPCTTIAPYTINPFYDVNVTLRYVYKDFSCGGTNDFFTTLQTDEQNGSVLMDVTVSVKADQNLSTEPIRYFRRTIQKL